MLVSSTLTTGDLTVKEYFNTETSYVTSLEWSNTSDDTSYVLQVYNEATGGRYNYVLTPTEGDDFSAIDGFISSPKTELFIRVLGTVPV